MSLSLVQAFEAKERGEISWEEYIHHLFARFAGIKHEDDDIEGIHTDLRFADPFGYSIWCMSDDITEPMEDTSQLEAVFIAYRRGTLEDVKSKCAALQDPLAKEILEPLAFLALKERRADVLEFCIDEGSFAHEAYFVEEADHMDPKKEPEISRILRKSGYERVVPWKERTKNGTIDEGYTHPAATFDRGGRLPVDW